MQLFLDAAAHLFLGAVCPICRTPGWGPCQPCTRALDLEESHLVSRVGIDVPIVAAHNYRPVFVNLIPRYKDRGAWHLGRLLASRLAKAVTAISDSPDTLLVPVPSLPAAVRRRGFDHGRDLARRAAKRLGLDWKVALRRAATGLDQRALAKADRRLNMHGAMRLRNPAAMPRVGGVVVCDDVITTGSSLKEAIRALTSQGVDVTGAAVIANADKNLS